LSAILEQGMHPAFSANRRAVPPWGSAWHGLVYVVAQFGARVETGYSPDARPGDPPPTRRSTDGTKEKLVRGSSSTRGGDEAGWFVLWTALGKSAGAVATNHLHWRWGLLKWFAFGGFVTQQRGSPISAGGGQSKAEGGAFSTQDGPAPRNPRGAAQQRRQPLARPGVPPPPTPPGGFFFLRGGGGGGGGGGWRGGGGGGGGEGGVGRDGGGGRGGGRVGPGGPGCERRENSDPGPKTQPGGFIAVTPDEVPNRT